ncbi:MAG: SgcJ/EcaC family oxidoreductase [Candidatus Acidiferrales bacterium]
MNSIPGKIAVSLILAISLACAAGWAEQGSEASAGDTAGIKKTVDAFSEAFNAHDAHATALTFAEDADFTNMRGTSRHGRKDIEAFYATLYSGILKSAHRDDQVARIRMLAPGVAFVDCDWQMTGSKSPDGKDNPPRKGLLMWVMAKAKGQWRITVFHEADL